MIETEQDARRDLAIKRIREKDGFKTHLITYVAVNAMLVVIWAVIGVGFFWPVFPIAAWGMGLLIHGYAVYFGGTYTEEQVQKEISRLPEA